MVQSSGLRNIEEEEDSEMGGGEDDSHGKPAPVRSVHLSEVRPMLPVTPTEDGSEPDTNESPDEKGKAAHVHELAVLSFCFVGLQASYLTWGYVQEKVMTTDYTTGRFPSATFCVFSNRLLAILVAASVVIYQHRRLHLPAPLWAFAPCSVSNSLSSYGQYQALRYVSFPLQTLSKSTKVVPVMLMGKLLNRKSYPWIEYVEAGLISLGVSMFALSERSRKTEATTQVLGVVMLALYIVSDSFTSQWQSRVYREHPGVDQFQMMFAVNVWSVAMTLAALLLSSEFFSTLTFLGDNPAAIWDQIVISITSATGQLFIYYTIKRFGPVVFTIIMTTRQMFSMVLSTIAFGHAMGVAAYAGAMIVFGAIFYRIKRGGRG